MPNQHKHKQLNVRLPEVYLNIITEQSEIRNITKKEVIELALLNLCNEKNQVISGPVVNAQSNQTQATNFLDRIGYKPSGNSQLELIQKLAQGFHSEKEE